MSNLIKVRFFCLYIVDREFVFCFYLVIQVFWGYCSYSLKDFGFY